MRDLQVFATGVLWGAWASFILADAVKKWRRYGH